VSVRGIGIDLVFLARMRAIIARWDERFVRRVFTDGEIAYCRARRDPVPHFAARFAAKEAALKALGTGLTMGVNWRELECASGQPRADPVRARETVCAAAAADAPGLTHGMTAPWPGHARRDDALEVPGAAGLPRDVGPTEP
jgi:holo-[acyl-carrier protein] synthase